MVSGIPVDVVRKDIKNLHIGVYPPDGRVRVAAPSRLGDEQVRLAVVQKLSWIKKQQRQFRAAHRQSEREMVTGESHYVWGQRLRLKVIVRPGNSHVEVDGASLLMYLPEEIEIDGRRALLDRWYREELRQALPRVISKWEASLGVSVPQWKIRRMRTKWGSCNRETRSILLNVELAKKHPDCLDHIVLHEMLHLLERNHGRRFSDLLDRFQPNWRSVSDQLNQAPLAPQSWPRNGSETVAAASI